MKNIKELHPSKKSRYKQGYINPACCKKLFESLSNTPIIYRSSYEKKFLTWCEQSDKVLRWGSECLSIPYTSKLDRKKHTYYPDYVLEMTNGEIWVVEIKPWSQTQKPNPNNQWAVEEWIKNISKWEAAIQFCASHNMKFRIFTERTIENL